MRQFEHDANSPPTQPGAETPAVPATARTVPGAQPPLENKGADAGPRQTTAAGLHAIYETARIGMREMGVSRSVRTLLTVNQKGGYDCPSCAWPDPDGDRHVAEFCENGAKAIASEATTKRLTPEVFARLPISQLLKKRDVEFEDLGRITHPMIRRERSDFYEPISWEEAFRVVGQELRDLDSPDQACFYTSGRTSNEAAFMYGLFARQFGTNNLPDCSNMCHESSGIGLSDAIGFGKATVRIEDFAESDAIFVIGQNPGTCHPRMLTELQRAARNGCRIVSINPLKETGLMHFSNPQEPLRLALPGTDIACLFLPVRINGDVALLKGIMKEMLDEDARRGGGVLAHSFIERHTEGFERFAEDIRRESWDRIVDGSGIPRELIRRAADIAIASERMICTWAMGITQHGNGVANVQSIVNFALLRGHVGRRGAGLCPVRGHSNVQGDRTVGISSRMSPSFLRALGEEFGFSAPMTRGLDTIQSLEAMHDGRVNVFIGLGGNFLAAAPDTNYTAEALERCRLTVQVSTKLNRGHLITGKRALILPCLGRTERDVQASGQQFFSVEDTMGVVHTSKGVLSPASAHLRSEPAIVAGIAQATLGDTSRVNWRAMVDNYDTIRTHIERVVPGFTQYNERVRQPGGFYLPNAPHEGTFNTPSTRAWFTVHAIPPHLLAGGQLLLTTLRSHDQFNTTIYTENDRYRGIARGRRVVFLNPNDISRLGFERYQWVDLVSHFESEVRRVERFKIVPYDIPEGCAAAYYPETNPLVAIRHVAEGSNQPASKSIVISLEPSSRMPA